MALDRRDFLARGGLTLAAAAVLGPEALAAGPDVESRATPLTWRGVRSQFRLRRDRVHLGAFLLASHPAPVRAAIERHRAGLRRRPGRLPARAGGRGARRPCSRAAAAYLGARPADIALTDSTTMGLGLLYNGLHARADQELLTTDPRLLRHARRARAEGGAHRRVAAEDPALRPSPAASADADRRARSLPAVTPRTRVVALTWVHSSTGVKLPIAPIAEALAPLNRGRREADRILLLRRRRPRVRDRGRRLPDLGCDFFAAGCHKWLFGPRGTGLVWGRPGAWQHVTHTIPSFTAPGTPGGAMTPGGFHSFEHRWALAEAFRFHQRIGKAADRGPDARAQRADSSRASPRCGT